MYGRGPKACFVHTALAFWIVFIRLFHTIYNFTVTEIEDISRSTQRRSGSRVA